MLVIHGLGPAQLSILRELMVQNLPISEGDIARWKEL